MVATWLRSGIQPYTSTLMQPMFSVRYTDLSTGRHLRSLTIALSIFATSARKMFATRSWGEWPFLLRALHKHRDRHSNEENFRVLLLLAHRAVAYPFRSDRVLQVLSATFGGPNLQPLRPGFSKSSHEPHPIGAGERPLRLLHADAEPVHGLSRDEPSTRITHVVPRESRWPAG